MRAVRTVAAAIVATLAVAAHAQSFIPGNQVDDFGPVASPAAGTQATEVARAHASPIPGNQIDDFGPVETGTRTPEELGAAGGEPGQPASRAGVPAPARDEAHDRFVRQSWSALP